MTRVGPPRDAGWRPRIAPRARLQLDAITNQEMLLYPEAALALNQTGAAIVRLCDGERSVTSIIEELGRQFIIRGPEQLAIEVDEFLDQLGARGLII